MELATLTPDFSLSINGIENELIKKRVVTLRTGDESGVVSDFCEIELDDYDDALNFPKTEALINISLGYKEIGLTKIGTYYVKEIHISGARRIVRIKGLAMSKAMKSQKTQSHEGKTINDVMNEMGEKYNLKPALDNQFASRLLDAMPQFAESDAHFLTRLSQVTGAIAKPASDHLVFASDMDGRSVSGAFLPTRIIDISDISSYSCSFKETESEGGATGSVYATWYDRNKGEWHLVHCGEGQPEFEIKEIFSSENEALAAAKAKFTRVKKAGRLFEFSCLGNPNLFAENPIVLKGFSRKIPTNWIISRVEHSLDSSGFVTSVECSNTK